MIITAKDCWEKAKSAHKIYFDKNVVKSRDENKGKLTDSIYNFLVLNHKTIRDGAESDFRQLQAQYESILATLPDPVRLEAQAALKRVFDYDYFSQKRKRRWCAYQLCKKSSLLTCPYCNLSYEIIIIKNHEGIIRPALDHFLDKASYPIFAISLGNLVPSCHHCNSTFKGARDFLSDPHLNPLSCDEGIQIALDVDQIDARFDLKKLENANIMLRFDATDIRKVNSAATFHIAERYQELVLEARTIARNMTDFSLSGSNDPVQRGWVLRGVSTSNYRNKIFGRMILDFSSIYL